MKNINHLNLSVIVSGALMVAPMVHAETYVCFWQDKPDDPKTIFVTKEFVGGRNGKEIASFERMVGESRIYSAEIQNGKMLESIKVIFDGYDIHYFWITYKETTESVSYEYYKGSCK